jgi:hypothetical protein
MAELSGLKLWQILQIVKYYLLWDRAIIILPITQQTRFATPGHLSKYKLGVKEQFTAQFGDVDVIKVLGQFASPSTLEQFRMSACVTEKHTEIITFLLQKRLLDQLYAFPTFVPSTAENSEEEMEEEDNKTGKMEMLLNSSISEMIRNAPSLDSATKRRMRQICQSALHKTGVHQRKLHYIVSNFIGALPYLNGKHHIKEIAYLCELRENDLQNALRMFYDLVENNYCVDKSLCF